MVELRKILFKEGKGLVGYQVGSAPSQIDEIREVRNLHIRKPLKPLNLPPDFETRVIELNNQGLDRSQIAKVLGMRYYNVSIATLRLAEEGKIQICSGKLVPNSLVDQIEDCRKRGVDHSQIIDSLLDPPRVTQTLLYCVFRELDRRWVREPTR